VSGRRANVNFGRGALDILVARQAIITINGEGDYMLKNHENSLIPIAIMRGTEKILLQIGQTVKLEFRDEIVLDEWQAVMEAKWRFERADAAGEGSGDAASSASASQARPRVGSQTLACPASLARSHAFPVLRAYPWQETSRVSAAPTQLRSSSPMSAASTPGTLAPSSRPTSLTKEHRAPAVRAQAVTEIDLAGDDADMLVDLSEDKPEVKPPSTPASTSKRGGERPGLGTPADPILVSSDEDNSAGKGKAVQDSDSGAAPADKAGTPRDALRLADEADAPLEPASGPAVAPMDLDPEPPARAQEYQTGQTVVIERCMGPNQYQEGGPGVIEDFNPAAGTYTVKYLVGGGRVKVDPSKFVVVNLCEDQGPRVRRKKRFADEGEGDQDGGAGASDSKKVRPARGSSGRSSSSSSGSSGERRPRAKRPALAKQQPVVKVERQAVSSSSTGPARSEAAEVDLKKHAAGEEEVKGVDDLRKPAPSLGMELADEEEEREGEEDRSKEEADSSDEEEEEENEEEGAPMDMILKCMFCSQTFKMKDHPKMHEHVTRCRRREVEEARESGRSAKIAAKELPSSLANCLQTNLACHDPTFVLGALETWTSRLEEKHIPPLRVQDSILQHLLDTRCPLRARCFHRMLCLIRDQFPPERYANSWSPVDFKLLKKVTSERSNKRVPSSALALDYFVKIFEGERTTLGTSLSRRSMLGKLIMEGSAEDPGNVLAGLVEDAIKSLHILKGISRSKDPLMTSLPAAPSLTTCACAAAMLRAGENIKNFDVKGLLYSDEPEVRLLERARPPRP
jgi:hypothetical protein